jgi:hypothetical protein
MWTGVEVGGRERMTDKQVAEINRIIKECPHKQLGAVCRMQVLPCARAIDKGICPEIIDYLQKYRAESEESDADSN